jgi:hypothetical protein
MVPYKGVSKRGMCLQQGDKVMLGTPFLTLHKNNTAPSPPIDLKPPPFERYGEGEQKYPRENQSLGWGLGGVGRCNTKLSIHHEAVGVEF